MHVYVSLSVLFISVLSIVGAFPQGAPSEVCEMLSPRRGHGGRSQPLENSPYGIFQSASFYRQGDIIKVELAQLDPEVEIPFKGFIIQAVDPVRKSFIGTFRDGPGLTVMHECSAVTHLDSKPKRSVDLVWHAPRGPGGTVMFRGTIVQRKSVYYENIIGKVVNRKK